jgi:uncharacterized phage-associated protein
VLAEFCREIGDLWTTQAVKFPYLVDLTAMHVLGRPITSSQHKAWKYGVVTGRAWGLLKRENGGGYFEIYGDPLAEGAKIRLLKNPPVHLDEEEKSIVRFVAAEFSDWGTEELGRLTKDLNPEIENWGGQDIVPLTEEAYKRLPSWLGEDEADAEIVAKLSARLKRADMIVGKDAMEVLSQWEQ